MMIAFGRLKPTHSFDEAPAPAAPDYAVAELGRAAGSARRCGCAARWRRTRRQATAEVDVFFVHPTTFFGTACGISRSTTTRRTNSPTCSCCADRLRCSTAAARSTRRAIARRRSIRSWTSRAAARRAGSRVRRRAARVRLLHRALQPGPAVHPRGAQSGIVAPAHAPGKADNRNTTARAARRRLSDRLRYRSRRDGEDSARCPGVRIGRTDGCLVTWNAIGPHVTQCGPTRARTFA